MLLVVLLSGCTLTRLIRYKFPNVDHHEKFKYARIDKSASPFYFTETLYKPLPPMELWVDKKFAGDANTVEEFLVETGTTSLLVIRNDSILYENYFNGHYKDKPAIVFSVSKAITTTLVAQAIRDGYLKSVEQKVSEFIPEFANDSRRDISLDHLLQMTSGLDFEDVNTVFKLAKAYYSKNVNKYIKSIKLKHPPGTHFAYKSIDTQILAYCLEIALGNIRISEYLQENLWSPIGTEYDALITLDQENGNPRMYGGIAACTRDLAKFGKLFLQEGKWNNTQIVPNQWVVDTKKRDNDGKWWGYNNGWWMDGFADGNLFEKRDFFAAGFKGQMVYVNPDYNMIIVRQGRNRDKIFWGYIISRLSSVINRPANCKPDQLLSENVIGEYFNEDGKKLKISFNGNFFETQGIGVSKLTYIEECPQTLFNDKLRIRLLFHKEKGEIVGLWVDDFKTLTHYTKAGG